MIGSSRASSFSSASTCAARRLAAAARERREQLERLALDLEHVAGGQARDPAPDLRRVAQRIVEAPQPVEDGLDHRDQDGRARVSSVAGSAARRSSCARSGSSRRGASRGGRRRCRCATMSRNMSLRLPAIVISSTGYAICAVLDPEARGAARVVAGHRIDALPELLGHEQPAAHARAAARQVVVARRRRDCALPPALPVDSHARACAPSSCRGNSPARRRRATTSRASVATPSLSNGALPRARGRCGSSRIVTCGANTCVPSESSRNDDLRYRLPPDTACTNEPIRSRGLRGLEQHRAFERAELARAEPAHRALAGDAADFGRAAAGRPRSPFKTVMYPTKTNSPTPAMATSVVSSSPSSPGMSRSATNRAGGVTSRTSGRMIQRYSGAPITNSGLTSGWVRA